MTILCVLGVERSGTSRTISVLRAFANFYCRGEIFHPVASHTLQDDLGDFARDFGFAALIDVGDPRLVSLVRSQPDVLLQWLLKRASGKTLVFKLFAGHLSKAAAEGLFSRYDMRFLITCRRPLDCYISELKARSIGRWSNVDTSSVDVKGNVENFANYMQHSEDWYDFIRSVIELRPHASLGYDNEIVLSDEDAATVLRGKLTSIGLDPGPFDNSAVTLRKQDRTLTYAQKLTNWPAFVAELKRVGLYLPAIEEPQME